VRVAPLPPWLDAARLLGEGDWQLTRYPSFIEATAELDAPVAADLGARLRGVTLAGKPVEYEVTPRLARTLVRQARLEEARRYRDRSVGFSRPGAMIDDETRLGLTPEALALDLGERARDVAHAPTVIDLCCGVGGNAIGFARSALRVIAIEIDPHRLAAARHNAALYGVADRIAFFQGDARDYLTGHEDALLFADVPWAVRDASGHLPLLRDIVARCARGQQLWAKVPADFDPALVPNAQPVAWFGASAGDRRRVKFLVLELKG